ncbi:MAG: TlpA family protein disulfide reductase [Candidatus Doudnabacteria bacterium]|nr:TlpA family protein disulfide reductase [Candidatus Doudnabacteria bacterium]
MQKLTIAIIIIVAFFGALLLLNNNQSSERSSSGTGQSSYTQVPDFSFEDFNGNTISLADFQGQPKIINSWAVWCPFCVEELKAFAEAKQELGDEIAIIAIDRAESLRLTKRFTDDLGVTDKLIFLLDPKDSFYRSIGGFSMPETLFVDGDNNILEHKRGPMTTSEIIEKSKTHFNLD